MNEHPILFSSEMVKAIIDGRKTQTRRVIKPQPDEGFNHAFQDGDGNWIFWDTQNAAGLSEFTLRAYPKGSATGFKCPYGQPGDHLWVRETFNLDDNDKTKRVGYKADGSGIRTSVRDFDTSERYELPWKPSIFMPRWASRITLEVVRIRVERVTDISEEDIRAEGTPTPNPPPNNWMDDSKWRATFAYLWNCINEKRGHGWDTNPFVWVVEFRKI